MNRKDRRAAQKIDQDRARKISQSTFENVAPVVAKPQRVSFALRLAARILLSGWVLKRVNHPDVLLALSQLAEQAGRMDALMLLDRKLRDTAP